MAVEIKEVIIRAVLEDEDESGDQMNTEQSSSGNGEAINQEELIEMCVDQVLRILQRKKSR